MTNLTSQTQSTIAQSTQLTQLPPLSLYIHFPWCIQKCPYCDFNSHQVKTDIPENEYIDALLKDLENDLPLVWGRKVNTIFMGGGTPSLFSPESMDRLLCGIRALIPLSPNAEITIEANPGAIENDRLSGFHQAGINRISIGVQSFDNNQLKELGRVHDADAANNAMTKARQAGFKRINLDLMYALPQQTLAEAQFDIETAVALQPDHISYYQLTIEPNTAFNHQPPSLPNDENAWQIAEQGKSILADAGFQQYEVSAYAQQKQRCKHNENYWLFGDYIGIGAGAHAKITDGSRQSISRHWKTRHPKSYLDNHQSQQTFITGQKQLDNNERLLEFLMNGLRLKDGFSLETFHQRTGIPPQQLTKKLSLSISQHLISYNETTDILQPTEKGYAFIDEIIQRL